MISSATPNRPSDPTNSPPRSAPGLLEAVAPERRDGPVAEHDAHPEHVVGRHAVPEAVRAPGVERDVAADRADRLARGVRRVVQPVRRGQCGDREIDDAGFDDGEAGRRVEPQHAVHAVQGDDDAVLDRHGAAREARAAAAGHERHARRMTGAHGLDDLVGRFGEHHGTRPRAVGRQAIGLVGGQRAGARQQPIGRNESRERREEGPRGPCAHYTAPDRRH